MNIHGYLKFEWIDNTLYVHAFGPFNEEGAVKASVEYLASLEANGRSSYSIIEVWDEESLGSPEVMSKISEMWTFFLKNNCSSIAIVISNSLQRSLCEKLLPNNGKIFQNLEDAENWVDNVAGT
jgi:hypothetical protein